MLATRMKATRGSVIYSSFRFIPTTMRKFLIIVALAIFLYSPYGPSWGQFAVNAAIVLSIFSFLGKHQPKHRYHDEHEEYH